MSDSNVLLRFGATVITNASGLTGQVSAKQKAWQVKYQTTIPQLTAIQAAEGTFVTMAKETADLFTPGEEIEIIIQKAAPVPSVEELVAKAQAVGASGFVQNPDAAAVIASLK
jgi:hypothetical protein